MIVVLGRPALVHHTTGHASLAGVAARVASAAAAAGSRVELVGSIGDDPGGDRAVVALGQAGVGHAALLRDPAGATPSGDPGGPLPRLDAADVELGLRYLTEFRVLVIADELDDEAARAAMDAAAFHEAAVVALVAHGHQVPTAFGTVVTVLEIPPADDADDPDRAGGDAASPEAFIALVARYAVALDAGRSPAEAFADAARESGWERAQGA